MNKELLFLKYLDKELSEDEAKEVEKLLITDQMQRELFDAVKMKRENLRIALDELNPKGKITIPAFETDAIKSISPKAKKSFLKPLIWKYAAAILILITLSLSFWVSQNQEHETKLLAHTEITDNKTENLVLEELDYYISPNRNWNKRELEWTVIEKK